MKNSSFYTLEQQKKDHEREAQQKKVKDLEELRQRQVREQEMIQNRGTVIPENLLVSDALSY